MPPRQKNKGPQSETSSRLRTSSETAVHKFQVPNFKLLDGTTGTGNYVSSEKFTAGGRRWKITVYPDGFKEENKKAGEVSVFLYLAEGAKDARTTFTLSLLNKDENSSPIIEKNCSKNFLSVSDGNVRFWGCPKFIKKAKLKELLGDSFTIRCDLTVIFESHSEDVTGKKT